MLIFANLILGKVQFMSFFNLGKVQNVCFINLGKVIFMKRKVYGCGRYA